ncbi:MAG TPA: hypothetical protein DHW47_03630 [Oscillibacter sp.]|nr:hypothetical protein [Oscillibacter sp.]
MEFFLSQFHRLLLFLFFRHNGGQFLLLHGVLWFYVLDGFFFSAAKQREHQQHSKYKGQYLLAFHTQRS